MGAIMYRPTSPPDVKRLTVMFEKHRLDAIAETKESAEKKVRFSDKVRVYRVKSASI